MAKKANLNFAVPIPCALMYLIILLTNYKGLLATF